MLRFIRKYPIFTMFACFCLITLESCSKDNKEELFPQEEALMDISFSEDVLPLLTTNCNFCHNTANINNAIGAGIVLDNFADVTTYVENGRLIGAIRQEAGFSPMPKGGVLPQSSINIIAKWVEEGALDN